MYLRLIVKKGSPINTLYCTQLLSRDQGAIKVLNQLIYLRKDRILCGSWLRNSLVMSNKKINQLMNYCRKIYCFRIAKETELRDAINVSDISTPRFYSIQTF